MALCVQADVEKRLQWDITAEPESVVTMLIADATALMESEVGRSLESANRTETFDGGPWSIFLTNWPVSAMTTVTEDGTALTVTTDFLWYTTGKVIRVVNGYQVAWRAYKPKSIVVAYVGGYLAGSELDHLGSVCAEAVARAFKKGADNAAIAAGASGQIESVHLEGSDTVTYATASGATFTGGGVGQFLYLEEDERRQLASPRFRRPRFGFA